MILIGYIDANSFLFDYKPIQKSGLIVFLQLKRICSQKTKLCFLNFLDSKNFLATFLIYMILIGYIDANSFLFDYKPNQKSGLIVFFAIETDM